MIQMEILCIKTEEKKSIILENFSPNELNSIYDFYLNHNEYNLLIDGVVEKSTAKVCTNCFFYENGLCYCGENSTAFKVDLFDSCKFFKEKI